ncbi:GntR family transcriptional regulator [Salmonella enterica subsp. enterica]|nr:GntR family transcriptional regulator [Salmonella enterica subsp. enterica serovar Newport]MIL09495.1 GntR family transcriptional regulator [Salmonella enterica subsp. enterica serovar Enteritidis]
MRASADSLIRSLEDDILNSVLRPGERLDEQSLARRFDVSRTPVREALRHLASSGLIDIKRNQGATVRRLTPAELIEMFQVMAEFEGLAARLSARRMSREEVAELRRLHEACAATTMLDNYNAFYEANNALHDAIFRGARNQFLQAESRKLRSRLNVYRRHVTNPRSMTKSSAEHANFVEAIAQGDEQLAHELMRSHVDLVAGAAADIMMALENDPIK